MEDMESKMGAILGNPALMQQIMSMAQSLNQSSDPLPDQQNRQEPPSAPEPFQGLPNIDLSTLQKLSGFASQSRIDSNQQTLLRALTPYLSRERISKLERAMRAAKMAGIASSLLQSNTFQSLLGR